MYFFLRCAGDWGEKLIENLEERRRWDLGGKEGIFMFFQKKRIRKIR